MVLGGDRGWDGLTLPPFLHKVLITKILGLDFYLESSKYLYEFRKVLIIKGKAPANSPGLFFLHH